MRARERGGREIAKAAITIIHKLTADAFFAADEEARRVGSN